MSWKSFASKLMQPDAPGLTKKGPVISIISRIPTSFPLCWIGYLLMKKYLQGAFDVLAESLFPLWADLGGFGELGVSEFAEAVAALADHEKTAVVPRPRHFRKLPNFSNKQKSHAPQLQLKSPIKYANFWYSHF